MRPYTDPRGAPLLQMILVAVKELCDPNLVIEEKKDSSCIIMLKFGCLLLLLGYFVAYV